MGKSSLAFFFGVLAMGACASSPAEPPPPPPEPETVPLSVPTRTATTTCVTVGAGETLLAVSPEGDAWLQRDDTHLRVVAPDGTEGTRPLPFPVLADGHAFSDEEIAFIAEDTLFRQEGEYLDEIRWPESIGAPTAFCGDPAVDGQAFVVAGDLFERAAGQWWRWSPPAGSFGSIESLANVSSACSARDRRVWMRTDTGLWSVSPAEVKRIQVIPRPVQVAAGGAIGVAAIQDGLLLRGPGDPWAELHFEAGMVRQVSGGGDALFVVAGERLYRERDGAYEEIDVELPGAMEALHGHAAGGLWIESGGSLCHASTEPVLRVRGIRPFERTFDTTRDVTLIADGPVEASLDGVTLRPTEDLTGVGLPDLPLGEGGWHTLEVRSGDTTRRVDYEVLTLDARTFTGDILPIYETSCAGSTCHGADRDDPARPDLSTFDGWVENADAIRNRVGMVGDMPPLELRPDWGPQKVIAIVEWIDRGMVRGEP